MIEKVVFNACSLGMAATPGGRVAACETTTVTRCAGGRLSRPRRRPHRGRGRGRSPHPLRVAHPAVGGAREPYPIGACSTVPRSQTRATVAHSAACWSRRASCSWSLTDREEAARSRSPEIRSNRPDVLVARRTRSAQRAEPARTMFLVNLAAQADPGTCLEMFEQEFARGRAAVDRDRRGSSCTSRPSNSTSSPTAYPGRARRVRRHRGPTAGPARPRRHLRPPPLHRLTAHRLTRAGGSARLGAEDRDHLDGSIDHAEPVRLERRELDRLARSMTRPRRRGAGASVPTSTTSSRGPRGPAAGRVGRCGPVSMRHL